MSLSPKALPTSKSLVAVDPVKLTTKTPHTLEWFETYIIPEDIFALLDPQTSLLLDPILMDVLIPDEDATSKRRSYSPNPSVRWSVLPPTPAVPLM